MSENLKPLARLEGVFKHDLCEKCGTGFTFGFATPEGMHVMRSPRALPRFGKNIHQTIKRA